ncbi:MAG: 4Fe-4S dicluster domain-containing protein [Nanoarchaeota archaeon]
MQVYVLEKKGFEQFLHKIMREFELIAPVKKDLVRFSTIKNPSEIFLAENSYFPLKEYFFRKHEVLFEFDSKGFQMPKLNAPKRIFFGLRRCDLNAVMHQDMVFMQQVKDPYYTELRKNSYLLGYHCPKPPSEYCFCGSLELKDFFDLMFYDRQDHYLVEVGSEKGKSLIDKFPNLFSATSTIKPEEKVIPGADRLHTLGLEKLYENPGWKKGVDICLSCAACTNLCPTCYCFEIHDEVKMSNPETGARSRSWSSCQLQEFTKVAGGFVFRKEREQRFKHRIYHQLDYFKQKTGTSLCVGCGRCIQGCPTRIDFVKIINEMKNG